MHLKIWSYKKVIYKVKESSIKQTLHVEKKLMKLFLYKKNSLT